jgi:5-formyltetrahydrofolate cyclo-ligase
MLFFLSTAGEIDSFPVLELALGGGKRVFAPRLAGTGLVFCRLHSAAGPWERGPFGIRQPALEGQTLPGETAGPSGLAGPSSLAGLAGEDFPALVFVPGLAFDAGGRRLGRGGGYYDRFLAELEAAGRPYRTIGLCTACQLVPEVPVDDWDRRVDYLCTGEDLMNAGGSVVP